LSLPGKDQIQMLRLLIIFAATLVSAQTARQAEVSLPQVQAHSDQERIDYLAGFNQAGGEATERAANDFSARYPDSALRLYLYSKAMGDYQAENNPAKVLSVAEKVLAIDPNHDVALVLTATVLADNLASDDREKTKKVEPIRRSAEHAIKNLNSGLLPTVSGTREQLEVYRSTLLSMAYSALGMAKLKTGDDSGAEKDLLMAAGLIKVRPDPYIWYHLALAQDHRKKYGAALASVEQALQLSSAIPDLQKLAEIEHDRLSGLAGRGARQGITPQ
jgi:tetratricopeptide (TPR) repeat protein